MTPRRGRPPAPYTYFEIPQVSFEIGAPVEEFDSFDSRVVFARLMQAARDGERIRAGRIGDHVLSEGALGALNSFLRGARAVGDKYRHPWHRRAGRVSYYTKHDFRDLCDHLDLFAP